MTRIKICGIRTMQDARTAIEAGADMLGFNFYEKSLRFVDPDACSQITCTIRKEYPSVGLIGVFVNFAVEEIERALETCALDLAQLSGDESPELRAALGKKAFKSFHGIPAREVKSYVRSEAPAFLLDGAVGGSYGGTGTAPDWSAAAGLARDYPLLLAGGLRPDNVAAAVARVRPWGVDVASGVESRPGEKDAAKIKAFVEAIRSMEVEPL